MRWDSTITLTSVSVEVGDNGVPTETVTTTCSWCNRHRVGSSAYFAARSAGLHADAVVELRSAAYSGEQQATLDGVPYEVEGVSEEGEFVRLTLRRRLRSA